MKKQKFKPEKGKLLVSEPFLHDPFFKRAVILLTEHNADGTVGFILNKPINVKLHEAIDDFPKFDADLYLGGPVQRDSLYYIHTLGDTIAESVEVFKGIYWGGNFEVLKVLIKNKKVNPSELRFFMGYTGWGSKQLAGELKKQSWIVTKAKIKYIMDTDPNVLWEELLKKQGKDYAMLASFAEYPSLN